MAVSEKKNGFTCRFLQKGFFSKTCHHEHYYDNDLHVICDLAFVTQFNAILLLNLFSYSFLISLQQEL